MRQDKQHLKYMQDLCVQEQCNGPEIDEEL